MARWRTVGWIALLWSLGACAPTLRGDPEASEKRFLLGADYFAKGAVRPALEELLKAVELNPRNAEARNLLGIVFLRQAADSEDRITRASCLPPEEARLERAEIDAKFRSAREQFRLATKLRPTYSEAWNNLAVVELHFQRWDEAIASTMRALSNIAYPEAWAGQGNLGWAYFQKGDLLRAAKELRTAVYTNPRFCVGRYRLAKVYYQQRNIEGAMMELEKVTADAACPIQEAFHLMALVGLRRGDEPGRTKAAQALHRCIELAPQSCLAKECRLAN
ncbi:MAG TPA: tetratricopeptide repeat protein [Polyangia bacterium]|nr:tetratricopeptide repeat protein [Polyangia bacterium]